MVNPKKTFEEGLFDGRFCLKGGIYEIGIKRCRGGGRRIVEITVDVNFQRRGCLACMGGGKKICGAY